MLNFEKQIERANQKKKKEKTYISLTAGVLMMRWREATVDDGRAAASMRTARRVTAVRVLLLLLVLMHVGREALERWRAIAVTSRRARGHT
jgi:hypothetical protein